MIRSMSSRVFRFAVVVTGMIVTPALVSAQSTMPAGVASPSLVTSGQGEAKVTPDRVSVLVNVQTRAASAAAAAATNAQRTKAVLDALWR